MSNPYPYPPATYPRISAAELDAGLRAASLRILGWAPRQGFPFSTAELMAFAVELLRVQNDL